MAEGWKEIRVFISSTFKDMEAERDHLVRFVFPRLREELAKWRIRIVDVDLRWGVTADRDAFVESLGAIERCRPRFLCMLGARYGSVPAPRTIAADFMELLRRGTSPVGNLTTDELALVDWVYPSRDEAGNFERREKPHALAEQNHYNAETARVVAVLQRAQHPETERSITASEVYYGALDCLHEATFRYFYFRDDAATGGIPDSHSSLYREPELSFGAEELTKLKGRIQAPRTRGLVKISPQQEAMLPLPCFVYPCKWDDLTKRITKLEEFGDRVYADLMASVEAQFGPAEARELPWHEEERAAIEAFVEPRAERYVVGSRREIFDELHGHLAGTEGTGIAVLVGERGTGKSALLARLWRELQRGAPDHPARTDALVVPHFVGASAASTNLRRMLRRLCHELQTGTGIEGEIPDDVEKLSEVFPDFLERAVQVKPVLLLVDAINQLDPDYRAHGMRWLPERLPANVRAVLTVLENQSEEGRQPEKSATLEALRARRTPPREVLLRALTKDDAQEIVDQFLGRYRKSLDPAQRAALLAKGHAGSPLYLLTALEELRTLGVYEEITLKIEQMPGETKPLFLSILKRLEGDDGFRDENQQKIGPALVRRWCSYLAAGRAGMSQRELAELVAPARERRPEDESDPQPDELGNVAALQRLLRPYLISRGELLDFFHEQLKEAVVGEYLEEEQQRLNTHRAIAAHFLKRADPAGDQSWSAHDARALSELPFHQIEGGMLDELYGVLTDLGFLEEKCTYVSATKTGEGDDARTVYNGVFELQEDYRRALDAWREGSSLARPPAVAG